MHHQSEQKMMFHLLSSIDFSEPIEKVIYNLSYDLGDFRFENKEYYEVTERLARMLWAELHFLKGKR